LDSTATDFAKYILGLVDPEDIAKVVSKPILTTSFWHTSFKTLGWMILIQDRLPATNRSKTRTASASGATGIEKHCQNSGYDALLQ
jgi:hypothetical protein